MKDDKNKSCAEKVQEEIENKQERQTDIAVIGMACRFPEAQNYEEFWQNLKEGRSNIQEIPRNRWDWKALWGDPQTEINKSNSKWGGFIRDVDAFDTGFFSFSPREAEAMDPQQRIMLELTWACLEDAGVCPSQVSGKKVGVYIGVFNFDYKELQERKFREIETYHSTGTATAVIANRISYFFNLKGPSIPIDAACSGSLTAIHAAIQSLHIGECSMALAGGINLLLTPTRHISFSKTGMLSPTGSCKTFDESADGYVRSEGAGLILLKPLEKAIKDGDSIYGILKGSAINHNGKTHTLTYPSPDAQAEVIMEACKQARVMPESISYVEAHGTGTPKGDPIEFQGLLKAFASLSSPEEQSSKNNYCGLGSAKTNIGHLEAAAGVAGVIKVLLSMKYKQLPGLQNFQRLNHRITIENSPFYFIDQLQAWKPLKDENNQVYPRRAGVSSFGFGGTNAHIVLEEAPVTTKRSNTKVPCYLICLSAKTQEALRHKEEDLFHWLEEKGQEHKLIDISATLLMGREHFETRSAFVVRDVQELQEKLKQVLTKGEAEGYFTESNKGKQIRPLFAELGKTIIKELQANKLKDEQEYGHKLMALAELYATGHNLDWKMIFPDGKTHRINLPTYPFARERYWIPDSDADIYSTITSSVNRATIHPLLHHNTSDLSEQRFSSTFTGQEFFLADHVVKGQRILPGVAYLEMARAAVEQAAGALKGGQAGIRLQNIVWARPIAVGEQPVQVHIGLYPEGNGDIAYEIYSEPPTDNVEPVIHSQGSAVLAAVGEVPTLDLHALQAQCSQGTISSMQCYEAFRTVGLDYGPGHQGIQEVYVGQGQVLAKLALPSTVSDTKDRLILHPSLMDAALQASLLIDFREVKLALPFALQELEIFGNCNSSMWALVRYSEGSKAGDKLQKLDIDLCDGQGHVCVRMKSFSSRVLEGEVDSVGSVEALGTLMLKPCWQEQDIPQEATMPAYEQHLVMLCEPGTVSQGIIETQVNGVRCLTLQSKQESIEERFRNYAVQAFEEIQKILKDKPKGKVLVQIVVPNQGEQQLLSGLSGLLKTAQLENPKLIGQLIEVEPGKNPDTITEILKENSRNFIDNHIRYQDGKRYVAGWSEVEASQATVKIPWKDQGVYLITGGAGGLGLIFAKEIAYKVEAATLILTGRSPLNADKQAQLKELEALGARIEYKQVDVTQKQAVVGLVQSIQENFGSLHGIIHSAGVIRDNFILKKTQEELQAVLGPKVAGLINLDEASKDLSLDFMVLFSSTTGALGNPGQADYATANAFMDTYARYRNSLVASQQRRGQTLSMNWPLWKEGGMHVDQETEKMMMQNMGMIAMQTSTGIRALYQGLASGKDQVMVVEGDVKRLHALLLEQPSGIEIERAPSTIKENKAVPTIEQDVIQHKALNYFKKLLSSAIKLPTHRIEADAPLEKYGIDSIMVMQLTNQLEKIFGSLSKTLFFEYQNIKDLTGYFLEAYRDQLTELLGIKEKAAATTETSEDSVAKGEPVYSVISTRKRPRFASLPRMETPQEKSGALDIAIIGVSGRYPQAKNIQEFWKNLRDGRDCVTEIPKDRWDHSLYYDKDKNNPGKSYSKWGGFLDGVDQFDPLFFNISPREAEIMDPQERLFLQCVYEVIEDGGYTREALGLQQSLGLGDNVGVYVGVMYEEYQLYGAQAQIQGKPVSVWGNPSCIANRVSYYCNFNGPSMAVDTMCSSSLTAIHLACQSLQQGECEVAIAGGVNVSIHPNKYLFLSQGKFVSSKGRCESFGQGADGYVPGEGVGAVLLKPLAQAVADGDHIYGIIKATAINHGGRNNGYTVPSPNAQASVIGRAFKKAGIEPRAISYIEAHGTGTSLGDPIEITGLTKAFQKYTKDQQFCAIGSAKSNIGHCESAAGIAGLTKILLQLKYRQLVPSLHSKVLNPNIDFSNTPFIVQQELAEWKRPVVEMNGETKEYLRIAGLSSFGAGGANAHVVIEEYIPKNLERLQIAITPQDPAVIVLSAKNEERLKEQAQQLLGAIDEQRLLDENLADIAFTLQVGREAMEERLGLIVTSIKELEEKLRGFVEGQDGIEDLYRGQVKRNKETLAVFTADEDLQKAIDTWINKGKYVKLLDIWVKGLIVDWHKLYSEIKPRRISLPTYPFARERYWVPQIDTKISNATVIHPLLHQNTSDLSEQRFSSTFTGQEFFLADHVVKGQRILPGVAYLEMARAAVEQAAGSLKGGRNGMRLKNIVWTRPIAIGEQPVQVHIGIYPEANGDIAYEIYSEPLTDNAEPVIYSQGSAVLGTVAEVSTLDLPALQVQCSQDLLSSTQCYEAFRTVGLDYGPGHQGIQEAYVGQGQVLAKLSLPSAVSDTKDKFILHPSLMDAALQASLMISASDVKLALPFALQELEILGQCTSVMWALIRHSEGSKARDKVQKLDIDLCDDQGHVCVRMKGFSARVLEGEVGSEESIEALGMLMLQPRWKEQSIAQEATVPTYEQHLVMLCEPNRISQEIIETKINGARCLILQSKQENIEERFHNYAAQAFEEVQSILKEKPKDKVLAQIVIPTQGERQLFSGLSGLLKTAQLENPKLIGQLIEVEPEEDGEKIIEILKECSRSSIDNHIRYQDNKRYVASWSEVDASQAVVKIPWKDQGVYLITGGAGGLGLIFAKEIVHKVKAATLILTGRSPLTADKQAQFKEMEALGARIEYKQVDVTQKQAVADLIQNIYESSGSLHGIIHSAGVIKDNFILKKTREELQAVLAPKVAGLVNLDQASKGLSLDFFVLFSSVAGALGNLGQVDYATANAFMDAYARYRNSLVASKQRHGQTLSINWPLWKEGGMHVDNETEKMMLQNMGMIAMRTPTGIQALYQGLASGKDQAMVVEGDVNRLQAILLAQPSGTEAVEAPSIIEENKAVPVIEQDILWEKAEHYFKKLLSSVIKLSANRIEADAPLEKYGIDSVMVMQLTNQLEKIFGSLSKTLLFEYQNIKDLTGYFLEAYRDQLTELLGVEEKAAATSENSQETISAAASGQSAIDSRRRPRFASLRIETPQEKSEALDIAIIGVSGHYPQAKNIQEFWKNLQDGRDCITEIPKDRWDHSLYFDEDKNKAGKTYSKWGGFLDGVDQFDPLFFNISPREAEMMDPQERLFLQCVYETLEDAGYTREALGLHQGFGLEGNVGVYVGVMYEEYQLYGAQAQILGKPVALWGNPSSIANRVSYFCNFHGPSMAVDTMCSSSLTAIHLACQSLQRGGCELAIAGGVNVSIHPNKYLMLGQGKFVSSKGRCESFGQGGDGYVPGEGVGAVLLKPLTKAIADRDHIYGIIKATAVNHGGKNNGYTVPNPNAQASVIGQAMKEAGIDPRAISYIEAHGTGTSLGDPIEITGLTKTFQEYTKDKQFCAIGSAKSNIGHCESAAGIAGVTKVLLQLKHCQLVPSLHSEVLNPNIDFGNTPFVVQQELVEWKRPVVEISGETREYPRIAGISSFGAGGSNAHVVIEEYISQDQEGHQIIMATDNPAVIVLSAKNEDRLKVQAQQLLTAIEEQQFSDTHLADLSYTLQVGREAMEERLAVIVGSIEELEEKLKGFVEGEDGIENLYRGQVKRNKETLAIFAADEEMQEAIAKWIQRRKYGKLLDLWVKGLLFDWTKLYGAIKPRRISLPTYPFAKERYWVPRIETNSAGSVFATSAIISPIHPLLHQNTSDFSEQRFSSYFTGQEFFLTDHVVKGQRLLPGVAYLEMARAAVEQAVGAMGKNPIGIRLKNVVWTQPINVGEKPVQIHIGLYPEDNGEIAYEIYSSAEDDIAYSQGSAVLSAVAAVPTLDLKALQVQCSQKILSSGQCYKAFKAMGIEYGPGHQGIEAVYIGQGQVLAKLFLPSSVSATQNQFVLHPSLMDSALQASIGFMTVDGETGGQASLKPVLPFALQELEILANCTSAMWAVLRYSEGSKAGDKVQKLDIDLCDEQGHVCVRMKGFSSRVLQEADSVGATEAPGTLMLQPSWKEQAIVPESTAHVYAQHVVLLCEPGDVAREGIELHINGVRCIVLQSEQENIEERFDTYAIQAFEEIQSILKDKPTGKVLVQIFVPAQGEQKLFSGLLGLLKTVQLENPKFIGQLIEVEPGEDMEGIVEKMKENSRSHIDNHICYQDNTRYVAGWSEIEVSQTAVKIPWKDQGVYLITGGAGGLGLIFAKEIAHIVKDVTLILTGRSPLNADKQAKLKELEALGARIEYKQVGVTQKQAVVDLIQSIQANYGNLDGIIHSAGVIKDNFILKKNKEELQEVMAPKVTGLVHLDQSTKDLPLDFFILFSSVAGAMGNMGQADYSTANAFMDAYARYRNSLVMSRQRYGQTLSMNWPLWKDGGMRVDAETEKVLMEKLGMIAMQTPTGIRALYQGLATGRDQIMVWEGNVERLRHYMGLTSRELEQIQGNSETLQTASPKFCEKIVKGELSKEQFINLVVMGREM